MHGVINEKTDVFAFGVLLLELITGRRAVDSHQRSLVIWVRKTKVCSFDTFTCISVNLGFNFILKV